MEWGDQMKLVRFGVSGAERPGILDGSGSIRDLTGIVRDVNSVSIQARCLDHLRRLSPQDLPVVAGTPRIGPCVGGVGKLICVGLNYVDHAAEAKMSIYREPIIFMKATSSISGPNDDIVIPHGSTKTDWEVELGVVIGEHAKNVSDEEAMLSSII
jgi:2-keto-4-pentenoate hydratase/2-oxohepta-3-ene-1,7-dioic acid hydratase in catechol pathway